MACETPPKYPWERFLVSASCKTWQIITRSRVTVCCNKSLLFHRLKVNAKRTNRLSCRLKVHTRRTNRSYLNQTCLQYYQRKQWQKEKHRSRMFRPQKTTHQSCAVSATSLPLTLARSLAATSPQPSALLSGLLPATLCAALSSGPRWTES